ncbi:MAG: hypothetical protein RBU30_26385 [Polyangia bacterium]|jgi:hypothetical protein|nr:hypothetical protein [Polyangia bacterium]
MPIYVVRWPEPLVSLISARDEEELMYRLDEAADPGGCTWQVYKGPIWVDFELPVKIDIGDPKDKRRPLAPEDVEVDVGGLAQNPWQLVPTDPQAGDTPHEMYDRIRRFAFPALQRILENPPDGDPESLDLDTVKAAVTEDLQPLLEYTWRQAQLEARDDPEAELMRQMGVTVKFGGLRSSGLGDANSTSSGCDHDPVDK